MKRVIQYFAVTLLVLFLAPVAFAATWDFNSLTPETNINGVNLGGVTITAPDSYVKAFYNYYDVFSGTTGIAASSWNEGSTITLTFASPVSFVSIYGGDQGGDADRFSMTAYNSVGAQIAFADTGDFNGIDTAHTVNGWIGDYKYLSVNANGIKSVVLTQVNWGCIWDNLSSESSSAVPEPASMLLLGLGLAGIAGVRRFR